jgi:hypothetical protein
LYLQRHRTYGDCQRIDKIVGLPIGKTGNDSAQYPNMAANGSSDRIGYCRIVWSRIDLDRMARD